MKITLARAVQGYLSKPRLTLSIATHGYLSTVSQKETIINFSELRRGASGGQFKKEVLVKEEDDIILLLTIKSFVECLKFV